MRAVSENAVDAVSGGEAPTSANGSAPGPTVTLTIAGIDPSCGAGTTADLKTFAAHGFYGICCATALTVQSTQGVERVLPLDAELVTATLDCLMADVPAAGVKIGMLATAAVAEAVAAFLEKSSVPQSRIVLDPVVASSSGAALIDPGGLRVLQTRLLGSVGWITPNVDELALLLDEPQATVARIPEQAEKLQERAAAAGNQLLRIVVTGGHLDPPNDYFLDCLASETSEGVWIEGARVHTRATHGTGCAFSTALLCRWLKRPDDARNAVMGAKHYVAGALRQAYPIGKGKGPLNHFFRES